ncbi:MAG: hypothetical protein IKF90_13430, partial [Parasporobacterium sp.]|nr:hypothetical protein [Parasporobacterium sp.]
MIDQIIQMEELKEKYCSDVIWTEPAKQEPLPEGVSLNKVAEVLEMKSEEEINTFLGIEGNLEYLRLFSHLRANLFDWIYFRPAESVLLVGKNTSLFAKKIVEEVSEVVCINSSVLGTVISAAFLQDKKNYKLLHGTLESARSYLTECQFDYVIFTDPQIVYKTGDIMRSDITKELAASKNLVKTSGKVIFGAENSLGLKFWSGCEENLTHSFFAGLENYNHELVVGDPDKNEIDIIVEKAPFEKYALYYPYPDFWFPTSIYSDLFLPAPGELTKNAFSWENRCALFNELNVWNNLINNKLFPKFSNAFLVILSNEDFQNDGLNIYTKYSNDRSPDYSIRTEIFVDEKQNKRVVKKGLTAAGQIHLNQMMKWHIELGNIYSNSSIKINRIERKSNSFEFEHLTGESFSEILGEYLSNDDFDSFLRDFSAFIDLLKERNTEDFIVTDRFKEVFGDVHLPSGLYSGKVNNIDLIVPNVILNESGMHIIDYEWTFDFPIPLNFIIYRSISYFFKGPRGTSNFNRLYQTKLLDLYGITDAEVDTYEEMEANFQKYICGEHYPIRCINHHAPVNIFPSNPQVFFDFGKGFNRLNSYSA